MDIIYELVYKTDLFLPIKIERKQKMIGLLSINSDKCRFYFCESYLGMSITSDSKDFVINALSYFIHYYQNMISMDEILIRAGATMIDNKKNADIDLSPNSIGKNDIVGLLTNPREN